jgi:large subunit ribosomal protein L24
MQRIRTGDQVIVLAGRDKGKRGSVLRILPDDRVIVEGVNVVKRHTRPNPQRNVTGGIIDKEAPIHRSNVGLYNPTSGKAERVGFRTLEDGRKVRVYRQSGEVADAK